MFSSRKVESERLGTMPTAVGTYTRLACERVEAAGIKAEPLLQKAGLTKQQIEDQDTRLSVDRQLKFLNLAADALQDDYLGFHLAQGIELRELGLLFYVPASSKTLGEALRRLARYSQMSDQSITLKYLGGKDIRLAFSYTGTAGHVNRYQIGIWMTLLIRLCRELTGFRVDPICVRVAHRKAYSSEAAGFVHGNIEFGASVDEVVFPSAIADMPIVSADPYLNRLLIAQSEEALSRLPTKPGTFRSVVEKAIVPLLPHGNIQASEVARRCNLSPRTFVRRLASEEATFIKVLNDLRRELAMQYLGDHGLSISKIAWLLGYQEVGAFTNAFKHWTGKTPSQARHQLRQNNT